MRWKTMPHKAPLARTIGHRVRLFTQTRAATVSPTPLRPLLWPLSQKDTADP